MFLYIHIIYGWFSSSQSNVQAFTHTAPLSCLSIIWLIIFLLSWICIHHVRYSWKACIFAFRLMPYLLRLLHCFIGACVGWVNWGQYQKGKVAKLIGLYGKSMLCHVLCFPFVSVCKRTHCPFIVPKSSETKHHAEFQIVVQFWNIYFLTLRLI